LGTGEAFDAETPNTAVLCRLGATFLVDCGLTVPPHLWRTLPDPDALDAIYLTHFHADHTFGVPSALFRLREDGRRRALTVVGQRGVERYVRAMLRLAYRLTPTDFPFPLRFLTARPGYALSFRGVRLSFARSRHSVVNLAVRLDWKGKAVAISGDGAPTAATERLFRNCGVLVHETFQDEVFEPVHASLPDVVDMARRANVQRLYLIHLSRRFRGRAPAKVATCVSGGLRIHIASCGERVRI
jgi:ribonuclease BN (tRNA processing enzyme)